MNGVVVDSCVAIKWLIDEDDSVAARHLLQGYLEQRLELLAPDTIDAEVGNGLWTRFHRHSATAEEVQRAFAQFRQVRVRKISCALLLNDAMRLALAHDRSVYDCLFLALSLRERYPLVTADERLYNAVHRVYPNVKMLGMGI